MNSKISIFVAELLGTFGLVVAATGSIVYDGSLGNSLGLGFISIMHFAGLAFLVLVFGRYSMAHFNPAVTVGFAVSGHLKIGLIPLYLTAQAIGAISGSIFVKYVIGNYSLLGMNLPNLKYSVPTIFLTEMLATIFLMGAILIVISLKKNALISGIVIGGVVALDVLFFASISGASMNPMRSLAPAILVGVYDDLWLYWTAPFLGSIIPAVIFVIMSRRKM